MPSKRFIGSLVLALGLGGCPKPQPDDSDSAPPESAPPAVTEHCGAVTSNETWAAADSPHIVTCDVEIRLAEVTIEAGALVLMANNASLEIGDSDAPGALIAHGTAAAPVQILPQAGDVPGAWPGITVFREGSLELYHTTVHGGGSGTDSRYTANILTIGAEILLDNVTLSGSAGQGLVLNDGGHLHPDSTGLTITGSALWPVRTPADQAHTLPAAGSSYTGNRRDGIAMDGADVSEAVSWEDLGVPYDLLKSVRFDGLAEAPAVLTIGAGTTLRFDPDAGLFFSPRQGESGLVVGETGGETVLFTSLGAEEPGWWAGIGAYDGVGTVDLRNARVEYAEGEEGAAIYVDAAVDVRLEGVEVVESGQVGVMLREGAAFDAASAGITIGGSGTWPLAVDAAQVHTIPEEDYLNNGRDAIYVFGTEVPIAVTWVNHGMPYVVDGLIEMEGVAAAPAILTVEPGVTLSFFPNSGLTLALGSNAAGLIAEGEPDAPIHFTAEGAELGGHWIGIAAYNGTSEGNFRLEHATVTWAGGGDTEAAIYAFDAEIYLNDVMIEHSLTDGLALYGESVVAEDSGDLVVRDCERPVTISPRWVSSLPTDSQLTGNTYDYIFVNNDNYVSFSATWPLHSVDYWVESVVAVGAGPDTVVLSFAPGVTVRFETYAGLLVAEDLPPYPDGAISAIGTEAQPITFTAAQAYDRGAWYGISIGQACGQTNRFEHVRIEYGGSDYQANLRVMNCDAVLQDVTLAHSAGSGLLVDGLNAEVHLRDVSISDSVERGLEGTDGEITFDTLLVEDSLDEGVYLGPSLSISGSGLTVRASDSHGLAIDDASFALDNVDISASNGHGIWFDYNTTDIPGLLSDCVIRANVGDGAHFSHNGDGIFVDSCSFSSNGGWGVWWDTADYSAPTLNNVSFSNNTLGDTP